MSVFKLVLRSLLHYWRLNLAVGVGVALTAAILSGALVVGDSVKESLRRNAEARISRVDTVVIGGERFFTADLAARVRGASGAEVVAPVLQVEGTASAQGGGARENGVQVLGVEDHFWKLGEAQSAPKVASEAEWFAINDVLARRLDAKVGDRVILRVEIPGALSKDAPLSGESDQVLPLTLTVGEIIGSERMGRYSLNAEQVPAASAYLPIGVLQANLKKPGRANVLLVANGPDADPVAVEKALSAQWQLADLGMQTEDLPELKNWRQLNGERIFLDDSLVSAAKNAGGPQSDEVLTYLVNRIENDGNVTPYSMATGATGTSSDIFAEALGDNEAMVSGWLAEDLDLQVGDKITLAYFVVSDGRQLTEQKREFSVKGVVPMDNPQLTGSWTPAFPGLLEVDDVDSWEPGIPLDKSLIRDKDEDYWDEHRAKPKIFVSLPAAREMWSNRFGNTTSVRFPVGEGGGSGESGAQAFDSAFREQVSLGELGVVVRDLAGEAKLAVGQSFDFGSLFAAMSFFLIVAALILTALVFVFGIEQRRAQIGLLLAMGMTPGKVRRMFVLEAALLAIDSALIGLLGGWIYTKLALRGMSGAWQAAASGIEFVYAYRWQTLLGAWLATVVLALVVVWFASRAVTKVKPSELISGGDGVGSAGGRKPLMKCRSLWLGLLCLLAGIGCLIAPKAPGSMAEQGLFFGAGFLLTMAGLCAAALGLRALEGGPEKLPTLGSLGRQNAVRRSGRSLAVIGLMAAGVFMVTAVNSFRLEGETGAQSRASGTGGFALSAQSTLPVYEDLNSASGREKYGLTSLPADKVDLVAFRVSDGDDASCLNLNRAQQPRLMGVAPEDLAGRGAFSFAAVKEIGEKSEDFSPWSLLAEGSSDAGVIPGIIDLNTATYALGGLKVGDRIAYETAGGAKFEVELVALLNNTLLQGSVIIAENDFIGKFPDAGGYRYFLGDVEPREKSDAVAKLLTRMLEDRGLSVSSAAAKLNEFNAVQNTYLSIFSTLGGLGILLGTVGLAVVVGRNVLERRGQLGLMQAFGFTRERLGRMVLAEHWFLHVSGVLLGVLAAVVAVAPKLSARGSDSALPLPLLAGVNGAVLIGGLVFCWLAAKLVLRGRLMDSIRSE